MNKFRTASFWMSLSGAIIMLLTALGIRIDAEYVNEVLSALSGVLVMLGVLTAPTSEPSTEANVEEDSEGDVDKDAHRD